MWPLLVTLGAVVRMWRRLGRGYQLAPPGRSSPEEQPRQPRHRRQACADHDRRHLTGISLARRPPARQEIRRAGAPVVSPRPARRWSARISRDAGRDADARRDVEELVRAVGVGAGAEHARDEELRLRELLAEHAMNGIEPPSPMDIGGLAEVAAARPRRARPASHGGERRRVPARARRRRPSNAHARAVRADPPRGASSARRAARSARRSVGGMRSESFTARPRAQHVARRRRSAGRPSAPVIGERRAPGAVEHQLDGVRRAPVAQPGTSGNSGRRSSAEHRRRPPRPAATRSRGISTWSSRGRISPGRARPRGARAAARSDAEARRHDAAASPECTPSVRTSTVSLPPTSPRSDVVRPQLVVVAAAGVEADHEARRRRCAARGASM